MIIMDIMVNINSLSSAKNGESSLLLKSADSKPPQDSRRTHGNRARNEKDRRAAS